MKKRALSLVTILAAACCLAGCGQKKPEYPETETDNKLVLEVYAGQSEKENLELLACAYEEQNGDVKIKLHLIPDSDYTQQLMRIKNQEVRADCIFFNNAAEAALWQHKKVFMDLSPWYAKSEEAAYYEPWYSNMPKEDGAYYLLPYRIGKICVYYNKTLFDQKNVSYPPGEWTWEDYKELSKQLTGWTGNKKVYGSLGFEGLNTWWMLPASTAGAADPFDKEDLELFRRSAEWCHEFNGELAAAFPYFDWAGDGESRCHSLFLEGRLGMYFGDESEVNTLNQEIRERGLELEYDVAMLPLWDGQEYSQVYQTAVVAMARWSQAPEEAYKFMEFCVSLEGGKLLAENSTVPAWQSSEVQQMYLASTSMPEHAEYLLSDSIPEEHAVGVLYYGGIVAMKKEVSLYMLDEQELNYTFENIEEELKALIAEQR